MSHLRDLQKLRNSKNMQFHSARNSQQKHNDICNFNFEKFGEVDSKQLRQQPYSKYLQSKDILPKTRERKTHKRGISFGFPSQQHRQRQTVSPGLSIYNFSMKLTERKTNPITARKEKIPDFIQARDSQVLKQKGINKNSFNIIYPVGKGGFGKVWKVQMKKNGQIYAMKEMYKAKVIQKKSINSVMNERRLLAKVKHPFLVNMLHAFQDRQNLYLVMDYLDGGDLRYHIGKNRTFSQKETKFFIANIIIALQYLHDNNIIHRDIKPENLVLDSKGYIRLTDLGVSRQYREDNHQDTSGTPGYMAPEVICRKNHSYASDFFAVGVMGYEFMLGRRPYNGRNRKQIRDQILGKQAAVRIDQLPFRWSPDAADFVNKMLIRNPEQRLGSNGIQQIKQHRWFKDIDWKKLLKKQIPAPYIPLSIEQDYEDYKQQISQDTIIQNMQENNLMLRDKEVQDLFDGYSYTTSQSLFLKRISLQTTNYTELENSSKLEHHRK